MEVRWSEVTLGPLHHSVLPVGLAEVRLEAEWGTLDPGMGNSREHGLVWLPAQSRKTDRRGQNCLGLHCSQSVRHLISTCQGILRTEMMACHLGL